MTSNAPLDLFPLNPQISRNQGLQRPNVLAVLLLWHHRQAKESGIGRPWVPSIQYLVQSCANVAGHELSLQFVLQHFRGFLSGRKPAHVHPVGHHLNLRVPHAARHE